MRLGAVSDATVLCGERAEVQFQERMERPILSGSAVGAGDRAAHRSIRRAVWFLDKRRTTNWPSP
jgi:hypothetical protein